MLSKIFYVIRVVESEHKQYWPVGSFVYYKYPKYHEIEGTCGPGPFPGYSSCKTIRETDVFNSREEANNIILDFYNDSPMLKNVVKLGSKQVTITMEK